MVTDEGLCRVGWSTPQATHELGKDNFGFGFGGTGKKSYSSQFDDYGEPFGKSDTIGCYVDTDHCTVSFSKNGKFLGKAFDIPKHLHGETFYAAVTLKNAEMTFNFGDSTFKHTPQAGYTALSKASALVPFQSGGMESGRRREGQVMALIMEPARELAQQTHDNITRFKKHLTSPGIRELLLVGGDSAKDQMRALAEGVDIVTGTPGRLDDFISTGKLDLSGVRFFVLDEAVSSNIVILMVGELEKQHKTCILH
jgi:ATP-dependent RNA helicase DDX1